LPDESLALLADVQLGVVVILRMRMCAWVRVSMQGVVLFCECIGVRRIH